jgi:hypothetical protein
MTDNKMIMDDVVETKVSDAEMANVVTRTQYAPASQQYVRPRKTRTIIRKFDKKVMPNDPCPCGSGKKFKKCCKGTGDFDGTRELSAQEMAKCRYENKPAWRFKDHLN